MWPRIGLHVAFWLFYLISFTYFSGVYDGDYLTSFTAELLYLPIRMLAVYTILYFLLPRYVVTKRYAMFGALFLIFCIAVVLINRSMVGLVIHPLFYSETYTFTFWNEYRIIYSLFSILQVAGAATAFKLLRMWYEAREKSRALVKEKLESELNFLRAQVNPHFLFNTLNNIYALSLKNSPHTSDIVMKLSKLLRFMLYECNSGSIPLEKIRYNERLRLDFSREIEEQHRAFPPMLLLPLVENGFKHGVDQTTGAADLQIRILQHGKHFEFQMENSKDPEQAR